MDTRKDITIILSVVVCVALLSIVPLFYVYFLDRRSINALKTSTINPTVTGKDATRIIAKVSGAEKIPKNETPTVVLVTDTSLLLPFGQVMPRDYILLYHQSNLAVVFDEITNRIINAVPVNIKNTNAK